MLPGLKQRLILVAAVVVGAWVWLMVKPGLLAVDMGPGISLLYARSGWAAAVGWVVLGGLVATAMGMLVSGAAHPLAGVFSVALSLAILGMVGGSIDGLLWRVVGQDGQEMNLYAGLAVEMVIWLIGLVVLLILISRSRLWIRRRFPKLISEQHDGTTIRFRVPNMDAILSGAIAAAVGGLVSWVLLKSTDTGQVFGSLLVSFTLGGILAQQIAPQTNPTAILLSPGAVAIVTYLYTWMMYPSHTALLASSHVGMLPGLAQALPIHYASMAVAGCAMGVGLAQAIERAREAEVPPEVSAGPH